MKKSVIAGIVVAVAVAAAGGASADEFPVKKRAVADLKAIFATVESVDETRARARIGGTVTELTIDEGSVVEAGQRIAIVHDDKIDLEMKAVDERLQSLKAERELAAIELRRARELRRSGAASQARVDDAETRLAVAERSLAAMQAEREVVAQRRKEGAVLAPKSGRVLQVSVTEGSVVMPGEVIATIATERYILRAQLPERHARFMGPGDDVVVGGRGMKADAASLRRGRVVQVYPTIENGRVVADIEVEGLGDFFVGERVRVYVSTGERETFVLPEDFVYNRYGLSYVKLKDGPEIVVQTGLPLEGGIEVLSGLRDGDVVVTP